MSLPSRPLQWDIFCRVIDNFGDLGVCWRLSSDLASRGHRVRLWLDDATALPWMAPSGCAGVQVMAWTTPLSAEAAAMAAHPQPPCDVMVEAFGCEIAPEFIASQAISHGAQTPEDQHNRPFPVWINLEYLSAEAYVARCHALPSLQSSGPAAGHTKWFFYPGFTQRTGGLLREPDLAQRQAEFDAPAWLRQQGLPAQDEQRISLFCYEPPALADLLEQLGRNGLGGKPTRLLVASGRAEKAVRNVLASHFSADKHPSPTSLLPGQLSISYLPLLSQIDYDHLLWACDLNFVRGEDSLVRALWAGKPWVWQIYPQDDGAHIGKLEALLSRLDAPDTVWAFHSVWNGGQCGPLPAIDLPSWQAFAERGCQQLLEQTDLTGQLLSFVAGKKS